MKKKLIIGITLFSVLALTSCKKQYTCVCTGQNEFVNYEGTVAIQATPKNAESTCKDQEGTAQAGVQTTCVLAE